MTSRGTAQEPMRELINIHEQELTPTCSHPNGQTPSVRRKLMRTNSHNMYLVIEKNLYVAKVWCRHGCKNFYPPYFPHRSTNQRQLIALSLSRKYPHGNVTKLDWCIPVLFYWEKRRRLRGFWDRCTFLTSRYFAHEPMSVKINIHQQD